jgi:hypothetical protein
VFRNDRFKTEGEEYDTAYKETLASVAATLTQPPLRRWVMKDPLNCPQQGLEIHKTVNVPPSEVKKGAALRNSSFPNTNTKKKKKKKKKNKKKSVVCSICGVVHC